ncbi:class I SAM-dependent methyltransferase [Actinoplanes derwentensis]|uniref:S-adenosyl-L-methionine-dependent methyltransferase n=1 Tax=Actinoplanes derwentensis TaxID=113562 RepID=A0A1H2CLZ1_9ACTN|nr:SAM-dependent methyltransferase [Actinoplanes derwentensis]GID86154.1 S-adenosyl-L-methionine-dependent methyltransferase [Actinoplanes derwentensis]SDT71565.1 methyltransferase, TIGR00027 family [Actinoplanes derwentensis]
MRQGSPSRTAWSAARYRAAHQLLEGGSIFKDDLAVRLSGEPEAALLADEPRRGMRLFIAARHRFAEDALAAAVSRGVRQVVVLGAGLDTFAYRNPYPNLSVVEVDHPDTQEWKRERLASAGIVVPPNVRYLGVDFETLSLPRWDQPTFFLWLGVVPYLTVAAFTSTMSSTVGHEVVFDYAQSPDRTTGDRRAALEARTDRVAKLGEPWLSYFEPDEIDSRLRGLGFAEIEDLGPSALAARYFGRTDVPPSTPGGHLLHAR